MAKPHKYDPALSLYRPDRYFGSVSESLSKNLADYVAKNKDGLLGPAGERES